MHAVLSDIVDTQRLEGTGSNMQRDRNDLNAERAETLEHAPIEVQTRGRRGDRAGMARVHRLIAFTVERLIRYTCLPLIRR